MDTQFGVSRVEDDENGTPLRFYDRLGTLIVPLPETERQQLGLSSGTFSDVPASGAPTDPDWVDAIIVPPSKRELRHLSLEERLGSPVGVVNGLDRYLVTAGVTQHEVLVDSERAIPLEANVVRDGVLMSHQTFGYIPGPDGRVVRTMIGLEQPVSDGSGDRIVSTIELSNIHLDRR